VLCLCIALGRAKYGVDLRKGTDLYGHRIRSDQASAAGVDGEIKAGKAAARELACKCRAVNSEQPPAWHVVLCGAHATGPRWNSGLGIQPLA
jgi:hypothetical protein